MHQLPLPAQQTCHHCDKIHASVGQKISNCHLILFFVLGQTRGGVITLVEKPMWMAKELWWQINCLQSTTNLPLLLMLIQELECPRALNSFIVAKIWPRIYIQWLVPKDKTFNVKKISRHMHYSQIKLAPSNIITSFWLTFVPSWTCHIGSTWNLSTIFFSQASHTTV